jgi:DNA-binding NtrC family response regulator
MGIESMSAENTVLVVDDEEVIRKGFSRTLRAEGFRVLTAVNGKEALEVLDSEKVNVIICDLKMPVMGAVGLLEETQRHHPDIPVIVITGQGTVESTIQCMKKGAFHFVGKPLRADHLIHVTKKALETQNLEKEAQI